MGQKVHPYGMRLGIIRDTRSKWFAQGRAYRDQLVEDLLARKTVLERHHHAGISDILIERTAGTTTITIESAKPGIIIGRGGSDVDRLRRDLDQIMSGRVRVNVEETKTPETNAQLIAEEIAGQIERRASIRRAMGQAIDRAVRAGVDGIRVAVSGRLMGAEIARTERVGPVGSVPMHTLRADVDRGFSEAVTGYGHIGVQVFVCNGIIMPPPKRTPAPAPEAEGEQPEVEAAEVAEEAVAEVAPEVTEEAAEVAEEAVAEVAEEAAEVAEEAVEVAEEAVAEIAEVAEMDDLLTESSEDEDEAISASTETQAEPTAAEAPAEAPAEAEEADEAGETEDEANAAEEDAGDADA